MDEPPIHLPQDWFDEVDESETFETERLRQATATIDQHEFWPGSTVPGMGSPDGDAAFFVGDATLSALTTKGSIKKATAQSDGLATIEVLPTRLRLTTYDGPVTCRASIPLDLKQVAVPGEGCSFDTRLWPIWRLAEVGNQNLPWKVSVAVRPGTLKLEACSLGKRGYRVTRGKYLLKALPSSRGMAFDWELDAPIDLGVVDSELVANVLHLFCSVKGRESKGIFSVLEIGDGVARGGHEGAIMVVQVPALQALRLRLNVEHAARVERILRHMKSGVTRAYETKNHFILKDDVVELAIRKPGDRFPPIEGFAKCAVHSTASIRDMDGFLGCVVALDIEPPLRRNSDGGSRGRRAGMAAKPPAKLVEVQRAAADLLGFKIHRPNMHGHFYAADVQFQPEAFLPAAINPGEEDGMGEDAANSPQPPRDVPEVWGKLDVAQLERVCLTLARCSSIELDHCGQLMRIRGQHARYEVNAYLAYVETTDQRFESRFSQDEVDAFERNVALFGTDWMRQRNTYVSEKKEEKPLLGAADSGVSALSHAPLENASPEVPDGVGDNQHAGGDQLVESQEPSAEVHGVDEVSPDPSAGDAETQDSQDRP